MSTLCLGAILAVLASPSGFVDPPGPAPLVKPTIALQPIDPQDGASAIVGEFLQSPYFLAMNVSPFELAEQVLDTVARFGMCGTHCLWYCQYADGTVVFNKFRAYRDGSAVCRYFMGRPGSHDCDAWYFDQRGNQQRFCTMSALDFANAHGGIAAFGLAQQ